VLVGEETKRVLGSSALLEPVDALTPTAWRLVGLVPGAPALARHLDAPMVGRDAELARVVASRSGRSARSCSRRQAAPESIRSVRVPTHASLMISIT
jgi:hypothetical protein